MFKYKKLQDETLEEERQVSITRVGIEASIPGYKLKFFVDHKKLTDKKFNQEQQDGIREHEAKIQSEKNR